MPQQFGIKAIQPTGNPHILGFNSPVSTAALLELWNGSSNAARVLRLMDTGQLQGADGAVGAPTYGFESSPQTGLYLPAASKLALAVSGADLLTLQDLLLTTKAQAAGDINDMGDRTGAVSLDLRQSNYHRIRMTGDITLSFTTASGASLRSFHTLELAQDGTGSRVVTWGSSVKGDAGGSPPQPDTTASRTTLIGLYRTAASGGTLRYGAVLGPSFDLG